MHKVLTKDDEDNKPIEDIPTPIEKQKKGFRIFGNSMNPPDRSFYFRDPTIMRFWERPNKVFLKELDDPIWNELIIVQTEIKSQTRIINKKLIKFYAPIMINSKDEPIKYDYNRMGKRKDITEEEVRFFITNYLVLP